MRKNLFHTPPEGSDTVKLSMGAVLTREQYDLWSEYTKVFRDRWDFDEQTCELIGIVGSDLFEAEFQERGAAIYTDCVSVPVRNALYQMFLMHTRWNHLHELGIVSPILDYGSGVGVTSNMLWEKGYRDIYCHELPGIQREVMQEVFKHKDGIDVWDGKSPDTFNTVLCLNVLEHVEDPLGLLNQFYRLGKRVIADVVIDEDTKLQTPHIAPKNDLRKCADILRERNGLFYESF